MVPTCKDANTTEFGDQPYTCPSYAVRNPSPLPGFPSEANCCLNRTCNNTDPTSPTPVPQACPASYILNVNMSDVSPPNASICCMPRISCIDVNPDKEGCQPFICNPTLGYIVNQNATYLPNPSNEVCCLVSGVWQRPAALMLLLRLLLGTVQFALLQQLLSKNFLLSTLARQAAEYTQPGGTPPHMSTMQLFRRPQPTPFCSQQLNVAEPAAAAADNNCRGAPVLTGTLSPQGGSALGVAPHSNMTPRRTITAHQPAACAAIRWQRVVTLTWSRETSSLSTVLQQRAGCQSRGATARPHLPTPREYA